MPCKTPTIRKFLNDKNVRNIELSFICTISRRKNWEKNYTISWDWSDSGCEMRPRKKNCPLEPLPLFHCLRLTTKPSLRKEWCHCQKAQTTWLHFPDVFSPPSYLEEKPIDIITSVVSRNILWFIHPLLNPRFLVGVQFSHSYGYPRHQINIPMMAMRFVHILHGCMKLNGLGVFFSDMRDTYFCIREVRDGNRATIF